MNPKTFDPEKLGARSKGAYQALMYASIWSGPNDESGGWHRWQDIVKLMLAASDLAPKSCSDILRCMEYQGTCIRRGGFSPQNDQRELLFIDNGT